MKNKLLIVLGIIIAIIIAFGAYIGMSLRPVSKSSSETPFTIKGGMSKIQIAKELKKQGLVRSDLATLAYMFFTPNLNLQAGDYTIDKAKSTPAIIKQIGNGEIDEIIPTVKITFKDGKRFIDYAEQISENFDIQYDDIIKKGSDPDFLKQIINDYSFIDESILNEKIYYPLEGYLAPDTYEFYKTADIETILRKMLNSMDVKLKSMEADFKNSKYSTHGILTIASIIEWEGKSSEDRAKVSQVIYKRLEMGMPLGMDVTTHYGARKGLKDPITAEDLASVNPYNTRNNNYLGLPVGSICNPSLDSINAALHPSDTSYVYFIADKDGKLYFTETAEEFLQLKKQFGL